MSKGYSREHRDDLNQVVLELITESRANLPMMMRPLSGNASDKVAFEDAIERHIDQLRADGGGPSVVVTDSAAFTRGCLRAYQRRGLQWIMSVPATVGQAKQRLEEVDPEELRPLAEGYRYTTFSTTYAEVDQRWLVIYSEAARERAAKLKVNEQLLKQGEQERKAFDELCREAFCCPEDAWRALAAFQRTLRVVEVHDADVIERRHYTSAGRPTKDAIAESVTYHLSGALAASIARRERRLIRRSCFILATNELDEGALSDPEVLRAYKGQSKVERGFRFLKDPMFLASTLYLKRVERVMGLLMVMTVCLLVYAALEYRIRQTLAEHEASVPDQKGKPTRRPTARWVFELFMDVHLLTITAGKTIHTLVLNLREELKTLLKLMGPPYMELYS